MLFTVKQIKEKVYRVKLKLRLRPIILGLRFFIIIDHSYDEKHFYC